MIDRLLRALTEAGAAPAVDPGPEELADILWLAACLGGAARTPAGEQPEERPEDAPAADPPPGADPGADPVPEHPEGDTPAGDGPGPGPRRRHYALADRTTPGRPGERPGDLVRVPRAAALADPLAVMRALRPLGRRTLADSRGTPELDEEATVGAGADQRLLVPVLRPAPGRWLDLALVVDTHRSMTLWHDLVADLRRVIAQTGVFRDLRVWYLSGTEAGGTPALAAGPGGTPRRPQEIADPSGRRLVLVVTDTVADGWGRPALDAVLRGWGRHGSVALLNVLPERLWSRGAVRPVPLHLRATGPAAPNAGWETSTPGARPRGRRLRAATRRRPMPVPVVDAAPASLGALAGLVAGGGRRTRLSCLLVGEEPPAPTAPVTAAAPPTAELALKNFRETASPLAQRLAGHLSAVPLVLPVMTLVRRATLPDADHGHLAEVLLGGLLRPWEAPAPGTDPDRLKFEFLPGVREALLGAQLRPDVTHLRRLVRREVAAYLAARRDSLADFVAVEAGEGPTVEQAPERAAPETAHPAEGTVGEEALPFTETAPRAGGPVSAALWPLDRVLASPLALGVRDPGRQDGLPELTPYLKRETDETLREVAVSANGYQPWRLLVTGRAGVGKTRACFEALRHLRPDDWIVWHPRTTAEVAAPPDLPTRATVVWLDDADLLLDPEDDRYEEAVTALTQLWDSARSPLLWLATVRTPAVDLPPFLDRFDQTQVRSYLLENEVAEATGLDPRLAEAVRLAQVNEVFPTLANLPLLRDRLAEAPLGVRMVLNAAVDALRLHHGRLLPGRVLEDGSLGYVPADDLSDRPLDWFREVIEYATEPVDGRPGLLTERPARFGALLYAVNPAVEGWLDRELPEDDPPPSLRRALLRHALPADLRRMIDQARVTGFDRWAAELDVRLRSAQPSRPEPRASTGDPEALTRPYFFLSYAHASTTDRRNAGLWERRLFRDLCEEILQLTEVSSGVPVGFMDDPDRYGEQWAERVSEEIAVCRVFVPLYSPRYFHSELCGRQWYAFAQRPVYQASVDSERTSGIVPVLWAPMSRYPLPPVAAELQVNHAGFGPDYATEGLQTLMKLAYHRSSYELAVHRLARRIVEVAEATVIPVGRTADIRTWPAAFPVSQVSELRILVLAGNRYQVPRGRDHRHYGRRSIDWNPFGPAMEGSLARRVADIVIRLGYRPVVQDFGPDEVRALLSAGMTAPALVLVDGFALLDGQHRSLLQEFEQSRPRWTAILMPCNAGDRDRWEEATGPWALLFGVDVGSENLEAAVTRAIRTVRAEFERHLHGEA
ncbi:TIR-like protein FxsC [Kitasatospora sp. NPDC004240]